MTPKILSLIAIGGGMGAACRVMLSYLLPTTILGVIPAQILLVNVLGCFAMGIITELMGIRFPASLELRAFLTTGFLGGFTTFSAFSLDFGLLIEKGQYKHATLYALISVGASLIAFFLGLKIVRGY